MKRIRPRIFSYTAISIAVVVWLLCGATGAMAQCNEVISGLQQPLGTALTNQGNLIVSESGVRVLPGPAVTPGRISIVDKGGNRRTLLDGLPSAVNDVNEVSGPAGVFMKGRTLYVAIGLGDVARPGGPGLAIPNPAGPSSPIFSSVLAIHFSAHVENTTTGFTLTAADQQALTNGETLTLSNEGGDQIQVRMIANLPDFIFLTPPFIAASNPFQLVSLDEHLYVTDGGRNLVWDIDLETESFSTLVSFPKIANPLAPLGPPLIDPVPTGIAVFGNQLLVTIFTGFPFPPGASTVQQVDPITGTFGAFITGRRTAIDVLPITKTGDNDYLVLQHNSGGIALPPWSGPGVLLRFDNPTDPPTTVASCLTRPTSMVLEKESGTVYVSELGGRIVAIPIGP